MLLLLIGAALRLGHLDEDGVVGTRRQLRQHLGPRAPQQDGFQFFADFVEVAVADEVALVVEDAMVVQELEGGAEPAVVHELHDAVQFLQLVLQWGAGQDDGVMAAHLLDGTRRFRLPVLDALSLVQHDHVGLPGVELFEVAQSHLVVDEAVERRLAVLRPALRRRPFDDLHRTAGVLADFTLPLVLDRGRGDDENALDVALAGQKFDRRQRLDGLAQAHVVAKDAAPATGREQRPAQLVGIQRHGEQILKSGVGFSAFELIQQFALAPGHVAALDAALHELHRVGRDGDVFRHVGESVDEVIVALARAPEAARVEIGFRQHGELVGVARRQMQAEPELFAVLHE